VEGRAASPSLVPRLNAGKVYNVPAWRLAGSKYRDRIRIYRDTDQSKDPKVFAERLRKRMEQGFTYFKMDFGASLVWPTVPAPGRRGKRKRGARELPFAASFRFDPVVVTSWSPSRRGISIISEGGRRPFGRREAEKSAAGRHGQAIRSAMDFA
jgi:hypothetical protein